MEENKLPTNQPAPQNAAPVPPGNLPTGGQEIDPAKAMKDLEGKGKMPKLPGMPGLSGGGGNKKLKKVAIVAGGLILFLVIANVLVSVLKGSGGDGGPVATVEPTASLAPTSSPVVSSPDPNVVKDPSPYANDPEVLDLLDKVGAMDLKLIGVDFKNNTLRVPELDWVVKF